MDNYNLESIGNNHIATSVETPMRDDAFVRTDDQKMETIKFHFKKSWKNWGLI